MCVARNEERRRRNDADGVRLAKEFDLSNQWKNFQIRAATLRCNINLKKARRERERERSKCSEMRVRICLSKRDTLVGGQTRQVSHFRPPLPIFPCSLQTRLVGSTNDGSSLQLSRYFDRPSVLPSSHLSGPSIPPKRASTVVRTRVAAQSRCFRNGRDDGRGRGDRMSSAGRR